MMHLTLFLFVVGVSATPDALGMYIPKGSYQESCINCQANNHFLECDCETGLDESSPLLFNWPMDKWNKASMELDEDWTCKDIYNLKGKLVCVGNAEEDEWGAGVGWVIPPPEGSYQRSCNNCRVIPGKNEMLVCECETSMNDPVHAEVESYLELGNGRTCKDIYNLNGQLVCVGVKEEDEWDAGVGLVIPLPEDTYQNSCNKCRVIPGNNDVLVCECKTGMHYAQVGSYLELGNGWTCKDIYQLVCAGQTEEKEVDHMMRGTQKLATGTETKDEMTGSK